MPYPIAIAILSTFLFTTAAQAEQDVLGDLAAEAARQTVQSVAPNSAEQLKTAEENLQKAQELKKKVENAPESVKQAVANKKKKLKESQAKTKQKAEALKKELQNAPEAAKQKAKEKAVEKTLELLQ